MLEGSGAIGPWLALAVGAAATYVWRGMGVALSGRIDPSGRAIEWVTCVAYALLAGLIARMIVLPAGVLQEVPLAARLVSAAVALLVFFLVRRSILLAVAAGTLTLVLLVQGMSPPGA